MGEKSQFWRRWLSNLPMLSSVALPICLKAIDFGWEQNAELHHCRCLSDCLWDCVICKIRQWKWPYPLQFPHWEISRSSRETDDYTQIRIVSRCFSCQNESDVKKNFSQKLTRQWFGQTPQLSSNISRAKRQMILHVCGQLPGSDTWWLRTFPVELYANKHQPSWRCQPRTNGKGVIKEGNLVQRP